MNRPDFLRVDGFVRNQIPSLKDARIISVWILIDPSSAYYRIVYSLSDNTTVEITIRRTSDQQLTILSNPGRTINNYQIYINYTSDSDFSRVDQFARSLLPQLRNAAIISVWIQFSSSGTNYRI